MAGAFSIQNLMCLIKLDLPARHYIKQRIDGSHPRFRHASLLRRDLEACALLPSHGQFRAAAPSPSPPPSGEIEARSEEEIVVTYGNLSTIESPLQPSITPLQGCAESQETRRL